MTTNRKFTLKVSLHCFKLRRSYSISLNLSNADEISGLNLKVPYLNSQLLLKAGPWKFHVTVVQQWLRNVQKSVAVAVAKTPCCCHPQILLPWWCDVTLVLCIADTVHTYCCESVMLNYSSIRTTLFDFFFCLGSLKLVSVELFWSHWLLVTRANRSQVWCYTSKRKT